MILSGWGRMPRIEARLIAPRDEAELGDLVRREPCLIARGAGRAYGDSAINPDATLDMRRFNRMLAFDPAEGQLVAEAGVSLGEVIATFLPRGWFPAVTPGTKHVTIGGAIAADVHGKNHHRIGSFRSHVDWIEVMGPDGTLRRCGPAEDAALFDHTLGGMGLTGIILRAAIRLRPVESGWITQRTLPCPDLAATLATLDATGAAEYSVAWIDCLSGHPPAGRALVLLGDHAARDALPPALAAHPFVIPPRRTRRLRLDLPRALMARPVARLFNAAYFRRGQGQAAPRLVDWDSFFYPLDAIADWNRAHGRRGFVQMQCVLPREGALRGLEQILAQMAKDGLLPVLGVLKRFGVQDSAFAFPMDGYTLAVDIPFHPALAPALDRLDQTVIRHGGRFYLAKDARMTARTLRDSDPRAADLRAFREARGFAAKFRSVQSERLGL